MCHFPFSLHRRLKKVGLCSSVMLWSCTRQRLAWWETFFWRFTQVRARLNSEWLFWFLKQAMDWSPSEILELGMICKWAFQDNWSISLLFLKILFVKLNYSAFSVAFFIKKKPKKPFIWSLISCQMVYLFVRWFYKAISLRMPTSFRGLWKHGSSWRGWAALSFSLGSTVCTHSKFNCTLPV